MRFAAVPFEATSDGGWAPEGPYWNQGLYMAPQYYDWTCSCCALDWVLEATGCRGSDRYLTTMEIGYQHNVNPMYGLMDGSGSALRDVLSNYGRSSDQAWLGFDEVYNLAQDTTGMMSGQAWYHWVALRGVDGPNLWIANSAPGYKGIYDSLSRSDFNRLGGFSVVWLN